MAFFSDRLSQYYSPHVPAVARQTSSYSGMEGAVLPRAGEKEIRSVGVIYLRHMRDSAEVRNEVEEIEVAFWRTHGYSIMVTVYVPM